MLIVFVREREREKRPEVSRAVWSLLPLHKSVGVCLETLLKHRTAAEQRLLLFARHKTGEAGARAGPFLLRLNGTRVAAATRWTKVEAGEKSDGEYLLSFNRRAVAEGDTQADTEGSRFARQMTAGFSTL